MTDVRGKRLLTREAVEEDLNKWRKAKSFWNVCITIAVILRMLLYLSFVGYCVYIWIQLREQPRVTSDTFPRNTSENWILLFLPLCFLEIYALFWFVGSYYKCLKGDSYFAVLGIEGLLVMIGWILIECCIFAVFFYLYGDLDSNTPLIGFYVYLALILLYPYPNDLLIEKFHEASKKCDEREFEFKLYEIEGPWHEFGWAV